MKREKRPGLKVICGGGSGDGSKLIKPQFLNARAAQIWDDHLPNGWTVGITAEDLVGAQCGVVVGLHERTEEWLSGERMTNVWYGTQEDAAAHQAAMDHADFGSHEALAVSPLASGRLDTCGSPVCADIREEGRHAG